MNGEKVKDARELARTIGGFAPGAAVKLNVMHKGQDKVVNLTLGQLPNTVEAKADTDNGGSVTAMLLGRLCRGMGRDETRPPLPTFEPPNNSESVFRISS